MFYSFLLPSEAIVLLMAGMFLEAGLMLKWSIQVDLLMSVEPEDSEKFNQGSEKEKLIKFSVTGK